MQRQTTRVFFFRFVTIKICYWLWFFAVFETCTDTNERLHVWGCSEQQVAVLRQSAVSSAGLSSSQPPVVQKHTTAVPRIRHIFLCYFHINSAAPSCLSFLSRSNLNTSLHFHTRCCGLALSEGATFFSHFCGNDKVPQILPHFQPYLPLAASRRSWSQSWFSSGCVSENETLKGGRI